jgi:hypothetical protein
VQIFITRGEDTSGPYTLEQVQDYLSQGVLLPDDFAYHEGLEGWIPLAQLISESASVEDSVPPIQEPVIAPAPSEPEPVVAPVAAATAPALAKGEGKSQGKNKIVLAAVAGLLGLCVLGVGGWFLLKDDPVEQAQNQEPAKPPPATGTPEPNPNLPPPPTTEPTQPTNGPLTELLTGKRLRISIGGDEFWVQLNNNGTTLDHAGLEGTFKIDGMSLSITDDDGITTIEFSAANPKKGDAVTVTGTKEPGSPPVLGPIKAKLVKLGSANNPEATSLKPPETNPTNPGAIPALPTQPNNFKK